MTIEQFINKLSIEQIFALATIGLVLFCVFVSWLFINVRKPRVGILSGLGIISVLLLTAEWHVYNACLECKRTPSLIPNSLCCEWTGPGMVIYAVVAAIDALVFSWISLGIARFYQRAIFKG